MQHRQEVYLAIKIAWCRYHVEMWSKNTLRIYALFAKVVRFKWALRNDSEIF